MMSWPRFNLGYSLQLLFLFLRVGGGRSKHTPTCTDSKSRQTPTFPESHILNPIHTHFSHTFTPIRILGAIPRGAISRHGRPEPCGHAQSAVPARRAVLAHARPVPARGVPIHSLSCAGTGAVPARGADRASAPAV
jgi:hypothetical protein